MPTNWLYVESQRPDFNGDETTDEKLDQLQNYLYLLVEQMRYTTQNLDTTNINPNALAGWESAWTGPIYAQIEGEGERITQLSVTAQGIQAQVQGQQEEIQELEESTQGQIQVIQQVQQLVGEQGGMITDIQGTVTAQSQQLSQLELTAQGLAATVGEQEDKLIEFEGTLTAQGENIGTLEGTIQQQSQKLADLELTAEGLTATVEDHTTQITQVHEKVDGLEVGGRNLLPASTVGRYAGGSIQPLNGNVAYGDYIFTVTGNPSDLVGGVASNFSSDQIVVSGETDLEAVTAHWKFDNAAQSNRSVQTENGRFSLGITVTPGATQLCVGVGEYPYVTPYYIKNLKVESGNIPTDWTPAPEDTQGQILDLEDTAANQHLILTSQASRISDLEVNANAISATVERVQTDTQTSLDGVNQSITELAEKVNLSLTSDQVEIAIEKKLSEGVSSVTTSTGFTFNEEGLTVNKSGSAMSTQITEDGMTVSRSGEEMLVANSEGVEAKNLNASTYLIVCGKGRYETYGADRVGFFWIGG